MESELWRLAGPGQSMLTCFGQTYGRRSIGPVADGRDSGGHAWAQKKPEHLVQAAFPAPATLLLV